MCAAFRTLYVKGRCRNSSAPKNKIYSAKTFYPTLDTWNMTADISFWEFMEQLLITNSIIIDRSKGSSHPRYPNVIYPLDYGYLKNTTSSDGGGIDVWVGSLNTVM